MADPSTSAESPLHASDAAPPQPFRTAPSSLTRGYSLADLFLLVTACAVVAAAVAPVLRQLPDGDHWIAAAWAAVGASLLGVAWGIVLGLHGYYKLRGVLECAGLGALLGALAGPLKCLPAEAFSTAVLSSLVGSVLLVIVALATRRSAIGGE